MKLTFCLVLPFCFHILLLDHHHHFQMIRDVETWIFQTFPFSVFLSFSSFWLSLVKKRDLVECCSWWWQMWICTCFAFFQDCGSGYVYFVYFSGLQFYHFKVLHRNNYIYLLLGKWWIQDICRGSTLRPTCLGARQYTHKCRGYTDSKRNKDLGTRDTIHSI